MTLQGYFREAPLWWNPPSLESLNSGYGLANLLHARQNLRWYPNPSLTLGLELKTRLFSGESAKTLQTETEAFSKGTTYFDWERVFINRDRTVLTSAVDRAWLDVTRGFVEFTAGRQRVAWGTNLVWNPIDLFNPSSPFDFDDEEKPGADAFRFQDYLGPSSKFDFAYAPRRPADGSVAAGELKLNFWSYDWIALAGRRGSETVAGFAWAGSVMKGGFRGEALYTLPRQTEPDPTAYVVASVSGDYTFRNSLYLQGSVLVNGRGATGDAGGARLLEAAQRGELTSSRASLFGEVAGNLGPFWRPDFSAVFNPYDRSWYLGPSLTWSAAPDLDVSALGLVFGGRPLTEFGDQGNLFLLRLKWSY